MKLLSQTSFAEGLEKNLERHVKFFEPLSQKKEKIWKSPELGFLGGEIVEIFSEKEWDSLNYRVNRTGCPEMAVGGTGDVLAGLVGAFAALNQDLFLAACAGAYLNGKLGEYAVEKNGPCIKATDLVFVLREYYKK